MEISRDEMADLGKHLNHELQLRETFEGDLGLYCLDCSEFIFRFGGKQNEKL